MTTQMTTPLQPTRLEPTQAEIAEASVAAQAALVGAITYAADKMNVNRASMAGALKQNEREAYAYFRYGLACEVAAQLGALDNQVRAVYLYDDEATPEDEVFGEAQPSPLVHLIVVVKSRRKSLATMIEGLDRALVHGFAGLASVPNLAHLLDVRIVDDGQIKNRAGDAVLLSALHHRPLPILVQ